ncbi:hypothetical protein [Azospirillum palustre]
MLTGGRRREGGTRPIQGTPIQGTDPSSPKMGAGCGGCRGDDFLLEGPGLEDKDMI